jgi:hypothetical protein
MATLGCLIAYHQLLARLSIGFRLPERFEQFHETRFMLVAFGALSIWLDPFGMLRTQIFVNLPLEFSVIVDLARHKS